LRREASGALEGLVPDLAHRVSGRNEPRTAGEAAVSVPDERDSDAGPMQELGAGDGERGLARASQCRPPDCDHTRPRGKAEGTLDPHRRGPHA
jgi:hypothetical protein